MKNSFFLLMGLLLAACQQADRPDWPHLDLEKDGIFGTSANRAYDELLSDRPTEPVIVAVLDGGIDILHEDLKSVLWTNQGEIPGNGVDDDGNGYIDDVHGWNFVGHADRSLHFDHMELTRLVRNGSEPSGDLRAALLRKQREAREQLEILRKFNATLATVVQRIGKADPSRKDFQRFTPKNDAENQIRSLANVNMKRKTYAEFYREDIVEKIEHLENQLRYHYNTDYVPFDYGIHGIGNADVAGPELLHGSHVAGILAADRENGIGMRGIAANVQLMAVRAIPNGDERDEDVAAAIRYAVDNGAKVINMSFGKYYSVNKLLVDDAVRHAELHDVLLVSAAGNEGSDLDKRAHYPNPHYLGGDTATNWITVGASDQTDDGILRAPFSNYGRNQVDVFAPGVRIYSAAPANAYRRLDGTSMAAPMVAGVAALIRSHYPDLTAAQVKNIITESVTKSHRLAGRCVSGGVVSAYGALRLAEETTKG